MTPSSVPTSGASDEPRAVHPPDGARDALPGWSTDATTLAFHREFDDTPYEMYVVGADGRGERQINPTCPSHVTDDEFCEETDPAWSPDGSLLAFSWPHGSINLVNGIDTIAVRGIAIVRPDGSAPQLLTQTERPTDAEDPAHRPSGGCLGGDDEGLRGSVHPRRRFSWRRFATSATSARSLTGPT